MPWGRLDDSLYDHPKLDALGRYRLSCIGLNTLAQSWCNRWLTDGLVPTDRVERLGGTVALANRLVDAGLWEKVDGGYRIHDFLDYNDSRETVLAQREAARARRRNNVGRSGDVQANVTRTSDYVRTPRPTPVPSSPTQSRPQGDVQKNVPRRDPEVERMHALREKALRERGIAG